MTPFAKWVAFELYVLNHFQLESHTAICNDPQEQVIVPKATASHFQTNYDLESVESQCTIIKLQEGHPAIDFIIVDDTKLSSNEKKIFLIQVSISSYETKSMDRRFSSINLKIIREKSVLDYYKEKIICNNVYYVFVTSSPHSSFNDGNPVFSVYIDLGSD